LMNHHHKNLKQLPRLTLKSLFSFLFFIKTLFVG